MVYKIIACDRDDKYRYALFVETSCSSTKKLVVIQCNPSVANEGKSDPTVGKVSVWAAKNSFRKVVFLNLFAYISSDPLALKGENYEVLVGPNNNETLKANIGKDSTTVLAWGGDIPVGNEMYYQRLNEIKEIMDQVGVVPYKVGALSHGTYPRHGRMWNKNNRELSILAWEAIIV